MLSIVFSRLNPVANGKYQWFHQYTRSMKKNLDAGTNNNNCITTTIKSATSSLELLNQISKNVETFSSKDTLTTLRTLFMLQKDKTSSIKPEELGQNSNFEQLCRSLERNSRNMELNDVIDALKIISFVGTSPNSKVTMSLLNLVNAQLDDLTLRHIIFLDTLLNKNESNPLVNALKMELPVWLQIQIGTKIDYENVDELLALLRFITRKRVSDKCTIIIVNALILQGEDLNRRQARHIIWLLSSTGLPDHLNYDKLLGNSINVIKRHFAMEQFWAIKVTLAKMVWKYSSDSTKFEKFYDEEFYNKCADFVVTNDLGFEEAIHILRKLCKVDFVHIDLLEYILRKVDKYPGLILKSKPPDLLPLITALSQANYKPDNWNQIRSLILQNNLLIANTQLKYFPWSKLSLELLSLGIECLSIWNTIFSNEFIKIELAQRRSTRLLRIFELYQHVNVLTDYKVRIDETYLKEAEKLIDSELNHPLKEFIESAFGGPSFVYTKVRTGLGYVLDHVIGFDRQTMEPVRIENDRNEDVLYDHVTFDDIITQYIAVVTFPRECYCINIPILRGRYELKLRSLEKMGITVVVINPSTWQNLSDDEKIARIQREVKLKLTQVLNPLKV